MSKADSSELMASKIRQFSGIRETVRFAGQVNAMGNRIHKSQPAEDELLLTIAAVESKALA